MGVLFWICWIACGIGVLAHTCVYIKSNPEKFGPDREIKRSEWPKLVLFTLMFVMLGPAALLANLWTGIYDSKEQP